MNESRIVNIAKSVCGCQEIELELVWSKQKIMLVIVVVRTGARLVVLMINVKSCLLSTVKQCLTLDCPQYGSPRPVNQPAVFISVTGTVMTSNFQLYRTSALTQHHLLYWSVTVAVLIIDLKFAER